MLVLLATSAASIFIAQLAMPGSYSWLSNAISESAAQGVHGAWIARLGFLLFGFAVVWLASSLRSTWARGAYELLGQSERIKAPFHVGARRLLDAHGIRGVHDIDRRFFT